VPNFYYVIPEVKTGIEEIVLDYLKETKEERQIFLYTTLPEETQV